jgi:hypothetical protein
MSSFSSLPWYTIHNQFGILSSGILLIWPYHCSLFFSMMSGFPYTPIISFIRSFFILCILDFLADLLSTSISVHNILFISLVVDLPYFCTTHQITIVWWIYNFQFFVIFLCHQIEFTAFLVFLVWLILCFISVEKLTFHIKWDTALHNSKLRSLN